MKKYIDIIVFMLTVIVVVIIVNTEEEKIASLESDKSKLVIENNLLKHQVQKQCNADIEAVIELERVMKEMSGE